MTSYPGGHGGYGAPGGGGGAGYPEKSAKTIYEQRKKLGRGTLQGETSQYHVEHLVTIILDPDEGLVTVKDALKRLVFLNTTGRIWVQEMYLQVEPNSISLLDCHTKEQLEKFDMLWIEQCKVEAGDASIGRLLALVLKDPQEDFPDIYLFQTAEANIIQSDIESGVADARSTVKKIRPETLRLNKEKLERMGIREDGTDIGSAQLSQGRSRGSHSRPPMPFMDQGMQPPPSSHDKDSNLKLMNNLLDEIEAFVRRLQKIQEALNEMGKRKNKKSKGKKKSSGEGVLTLRAKPPTIEEFTDHFQKYKLLLNLLSDMKLQLKNPPANDMLHHLMRPLQMMVLMSGGPDTGRTILSPPLSKNTVDFMKATLTSQEKMLWSSLGEAWTKPESEWPKGWKSSPYTPRLKEPIGNQLGFPAQPAPAPHMPPSSSTTHPPTAYPPPGHPPPAHPPPAQPAPTEPPESMAVASHAVAHKSGSLDRGERLNPGMAASPPQPSRPPLIKFVKAKYDFVARSSAELSINREETLEVLDDSSNWWKVQNENGSVGFVPSNMVEPLRKGRSPHSAGLDRHFFDDNAIYSAPERRKDPFDRRTTQMDLLTMELQNRLLLAAKPPVSQTNHVTRDSMSEISIHSQPADVQLWLSTQGYHHRTQAHLTGINGDQLFAMSRDYMMVVCPEEGAQLYSRLDQYRPHSWDQNFSNDLGRRMLMMPKYN
ncbi:epidermal growth factor receptor kinase substrate 8-like [Lethenteron reissneri]|uniref:epidermal growth factor receptor kinase substrate 8-like n=1 Tax=Lethenteron reissneri TaxID=7753 RepID=UPI002AB777E0|nr:epidermal growth factor receptor kinase substrate 8-like [Lethenteron reissneri]